MTRAPAPPVFDADVAPILRRTASRATATRRPRRDGARRRSSARSRASSRRGRRRRSRRATARPILAALDTTASPGPARAAASSDAHGVGRGGDARVRGGVHDPGIVDPRSRGLSRRAAARARWAPMLDAQRPERVRPVPRRTPRAAPPASLAGARRARRARAATTSRAASLACSTCHGSGTTRLPAARPLLLPGRRRRGARTRRTSSRRRRAGGLPVLDVPPGARHPRHRRPARRRDRRGHLRPERGPGEASYDRATGACAVYVPRPGGARPRPTWTEHDAGRLQRLPRLAAGRSLPRPLHQLPRRGQRHRHRAHRRPAAPERQGGPRQRQRPVRRLPRHRRQPWPTTAAHPAHQNPTITDSARLRELPLVPAAILDPGPPRRHRARHLLGARARARRRSRVERQPLHERRLPRREPRRPGGGPGVDDPSGARRSAARATASRPRSTRRPRRATGATATAPRSRSAPTAAVDLGERQDAARRRHHRIGSLIDARTRAHRRNTWHPVQTCACGW